MQPERFWISPPSLQCGWQSPLLGMHRDRGARPKLCFAGHSYQEWHQLKHWEVLWVQQHFAAQGLKSTTSNIPPKDRMTLWPPTIRQLFQMPIILTGGHLSAPGCISPHSSWLHCAQPQWHGQWTGEPHPAPAPEKQHPTCYCALQLKFFCTAGYGRRDHSTVNSQSLCLGKKVTVTSTKVQWSLQRDHRQSFRIMQ